jgi:hypothetical protein
MQANSANGGFQMKGVRKEVEEKIIKLIFDFAHWSEHVVTTSLGPEGPVGEDIRLSYKTEDLKALLLMGKEAQRIAEEIRKE